MEKTYDEQAILEKYKEGKALTLQHLKLSDSDGREIIGEEVTSDNHLLYVIKDSNNNITVEFAEGKMVSLDNPHPPVIIKTPLVILKKIP